jgi:DNA gyrase subunit B
MYIKDDGALNAYLIRNAIEGAELRASEHAPAITSEALERLLLLLADAREVINRHSYRIDSAVMEAMLESKPLRSEDFDDSNTLADWCKRIEERLNNSGLGRARYELRVQTQKDGQGGAILVHKFHHGLSAVQTIAANALLNGELRQINETAGELYELLGPGASISRGNKTQPVTRFIDAQEWLLEEAKKGRTIQRFKGLGEMNPEQLWDTTVNPETRRLLRVRIEDAVAADQIFSTLMGDVVEPRRDFIEENALRVGNLDI